MCLLLSAAGSRRYVRQDHHATNTVWQIVTRVERHSARQHFRETMFKAITKCSQDVRKALIYVFARRSSRNPRRSQGAQGDEDLEEVKTSEKIARCSQGAQDLQGAHQKLGDSVFDKLVKMARSPHSRGVVRIAPNARSLLPLATSKERSTGTRRRVPVLRLNPFSRPSTSTLRVGEAVSDRRDSQFA